MFDYLETLPVDDEPEIFGLHNNANITLQGEIVKNFLTPLIAIQPRNTTSSLRSPDDIVMGICKDIEYKFGVIRTLNINNANAEAIYDERSKDYSLNLNPR